MIGKARRNTELGLILLAAVITGGAYTLASLGRAAKIPANIGPFLGIIVALFLGAHLAVRRWATHADGLLLPLAGILNGVGYVMLARLNPKLAGLQATWTAVGIVAFTATLLLVRRTRDLARYRYTAALLGMGLLLAPLVPVVGREIQGGRIWVALGPVSIQPGEFAKILLAIFVASYLVEKRELLGMATWPRFAPMLPDLKHLGPVLVAWAAAILIMTEEKDLGQSVLFFALFMVLLWVSTQRSAYLGVGAGLFGSAAYMAWLTFSHVQVRVTNWLNPWAHAQGGGYQLIQGWFALAAGGVAGTGLGLGTPERIPVVQNDFIIAAIGEELGLVGTTAVIVTYVLFIGCGLRIAVQAELLFDKLLATGLTLLVGLQSFIIIAGVTRLLPLTGVALPFVSYGGSSLVANYVILALLLRISDTTTQRDTKTPAKQSAFTE